MEPCTTLCTAKPSRVRRQMTPGIQGCSFKTPRLSCWHYQGSEMTKRHIQDVPEALEWVLGNWKEGEQRICITGPHSPEAKKSEIMDGDVGYGQPDMRIGASSIRQHL